MRIITMALLLFVNKTTKPLKFFYDRQMAENTVSLNLETESQRRLILNYSRFFKLSSLIF